MDECELQRSLELYRAQLSHVEQALVASGQTEELQKLISDLKELISLTEGSLLSLKKSRLLKELEDADSPQNTSGQSVFHTAIDDEYAAFQAALQDDLKADEDNSNSSTSARGNNYTCADEPGTSIQTSLLSLSSNIEQFPDTSESDSHSSSSSDSDDETDSGDQSLDEELSKLVGTRCSAPFSHEWGKLDYHNALVTAAVRDPHTDKILVTVMYTTPTHNSMRPCQYYLDGHCRFNEDKCRFSHGRTVALEDLRDFVEADHSTIVVDSKCLACYTDGIWYPATVTDVKDDTVSVHFDEYGEDLDLSMTQVVPSAVPQSADVSSDNEEVVEAETSSQGGSILVDSEEEGEELPVFLWQPPATTAALGEWEAHTRGIGSKLMSRMGYVPGQGLGVHSQGKAEPVPIMLLPQGKSLDKIMELKALAGNEDLFNAMKKLERQKKKAERKREEETKGDKAGDSVARADVFDFINSKLASKKGGKNKAVGTCSSHSRRNISEHELHKKSDKDINIQVLKTHDEIRNVERELGRLRQQLARNENRDRRMAAQVRARLAEEEGYLAKLRSSSAALETHQKKRSNSKKLTIF